MTQQDGTKSAEAIARAERIAELRGMADAAYGCGAWLAGASYLAAARREEALADEEQDQPIAESDRQQEGGTGCPKATQ